MSSHRSNLLVYSPAHSNSPNNASLVLSFTNSSHPDDVIYNTDDVITESAVSPMIPNTNPTVIDKPNDITQSIAEVRDERLEEEVPVANIPIIDPPQQLWSEVIQRSISHSSSCAVSPTPGLINHRNNHTAYTTIADQRIEVGPGFSTIYPSGVDHRLGQHSRSKFRFVLSDCFVNCVNL